MMTPLQKNIPLSKFLKKNRADTSFKTHISIFEPKGSFAIARNSLEEFYSIYDHKIPNGVGEMTQAYSMLRFDFDIKKPISEYNLYYKDCKRFYDYSEVHFIIKKIQERLWIVVDKDIVGTATPICCLFEKDIYKKNDIEMSGGFHLQFPWVFLEKNVVINHIINPIKEEIKNETGLEFDIGVYNNPWLMYGASKSENHKPYILTKIYNHNMEEMTVLETFKDYDIYDVNENKIKINAENVEKLLPRIFSIIPFGRICQEPNHGLEVIKPVEKEKRKPKINDDRDIEEKLAECRKLLPLLGEHRVDDYNDWFKLGCCLYTIGDGCDEALDLWDEKSQESSKYDAGCCETQWEKMKVGELTLGSLKYWAKEDSPIEYKKLYKKKDSFQDEIIFNDKIDITREEYYWVDFERKYCKIIFNSYDELKENIIRDLPRVLVKVTMGKGFYIKKENSENLCNLIQIKDMKRIVFKYIITTKTKKGYTNEECIVTLDTIYDDCNLPLYSHPDMIIDKSIKTNAYNIFKGIQASKVDTIDSKLIDKFFKHILEIICNDNKEVYHFFISWLRWIMIKPHIKSKIFVFLFSKEGYGKSTIGDFLSQFIFGDSASYTCVGLEHITNNFNHHLVGKLFVQIEELPSTSETFHNQFNKMKHYITNNSFPATSKGVDSYKVRNYMNFLGCSNNKLSLRMSEDDTRYFVLEITKKMDDDYWTNYYKNFQNQQFANMLYSYFLNTDDDDYVSFYGRPKIPMTELKEELIEFSLPSYDRFYKEIMEGDYVLSKSIIKEPFTYLKKEYKFASTIDDIYQEYINWGTITGEKDLKRKYLDFKKYRTSTCRFIDLQEKITNIDTLKFKDDRLLK